MRRTEINGGLEDYSIICQWLEERKVRLHGYKVRLTGYDEQRLNCNDWKTREIWIWGSAYGKSCTQHVGLNGVTQI